MAELTAKAGGGSWTSASTWEPEQAPTIADVCLLASTSGNVTISAESKCRSLDCTGYTGALKHEGFTLKIGDATAPPANVALKFVAGMTYTTTNDTTSKIQFQSTSATTLTIDWGTKQTSSVTFEGSGGTWKYLSSHTQSYTTAQLNLNKGKLDLNSQTCSWGRFQSTVSGTRSLTGGTAVASVNTTSAGSSPWVIENATSLTLSCTEMTIKYAGVTANERKFVGGGFSYGILDTGSGTGKITIGTSNNNTFAKLKFSKKQTLILGAGKTQTIEALEAVGVAGELIKWESTEAGVAAKINASKVLSGDYWEVKDIHAEGSKVFAGVHSVNVSGNEGITFTAPGGKPVVTTGAAATNMGETIQGIVNPAGFATTYHFQYVSDAQFKIDEWASATSTSNVELAKGEEAINVSAKILDLVAGTKYHYRVVATNSEGTVNGSEATFTPSAGARLALAI